MKTQLNKQLNLIQVPAIRTLTRAVLDAAPTCFWTMPASTTGKYHPDHSLGEGGLIRHTKAVVHLTTHLLTMEGYQPEDEAYALAIAAAILHDCCKKADHEHYTAFDHPLRAADLITEVNSHLPADTSAPAHTVRTLCSMVKCHMGRWNLDPRTGIELPRPLTPLQRLIHTADYLASRKQLLPEQF